VKGADGTKVLCSHGDQHKDEGCDSAPTMRINRGGGGEGITPRGKVKNARRGGRNGQGRESDGERLKR